MAVIPASVLHGWDWAPAPVCVAAADYLHSIFEQPLLCVAVVSPALFTR